MKANGYYFEFSKHAMVAEEEQAEGEDEDAQSKEQ
jgi:hypothetical protein